MAGYYFEIYIILLKFIQIIKHYLFRVFSGEEKNTKNEPVEKSVEISPNKYTATGFFFFFKL